MSKRETKQLKSKLTISLIFNTIKSTSQLITLKTKSRSTYQPPSSDLITLNISASIFKVVCCKGFTQPLFTIFKASIHFSQISSSRCLYQVIDGLHKRV
ncbi:hypothetical protein QVD17_20564 [Tagetes erecta]|uniref:Uncharacterized protein n=1 Tax=Tagetes erecta TaxID=13708 RepID=A0AAD8KRW3_TARER|nr:hypothetical protein QVD17_20564 [Tagetes erecta]